MWAFNKNQEDQDAAKVLSVSSGEEPSPSVDIDPNETKGSEKRKMVLCLGMFYRRELLKDDIGQTERDFMRKFEPFGSGD